MGAICEEFNVNLGDLLVWEPVKPRLHRIGADVQARLDVLMEKNNQDTITAREKNELEELGKTVEHLSLENARMLARKSKPRPASKSSSKKTLVTCAGENRKTSAAPVRISSGAKGFFEFLV